MDWAQAVSRHSTWEKRSSGRNCSSAVQEVKITSGRPSLFKGHYPGISPLLDGSRSSMPARDLRQQARRAWVFVCRLFSLWGFAHQSTKGWQEVIFTCSQLWHYLPKCYFVFKKTKKWYNSTAALERPWIIFICLPLFQMLRHVFPYTSCKCDVVAWVGFEEKIQRTCSFMKLHVKNLESAFWTVQPGLILNWGEWSCCNNMQL